MGSIVISQIAGMNLHYQHCSLDYFLDSMNRIGLKNIELWAGSPHYCILEPANNNAKAVGNKIIERDLNVICLTPDQCIYPINIAAPQKELRDHSVEYLKSYIRSCHDIGTDRMLVTPGWGNFNEPAAEGQKRSVGSIQQLIPVAEEEDVILLFEILLPHESNITNSLVTTVEMLRDLDHKNVECCIDTVPVCNEEKRLSDFFNALGNRITHIHLNDGVPIGHLTWGDGTQPLEQHLNDLRANNYDKFITLELADLRYHLDPEKHLCRGLDVVKKYLD